MKRVWIPVVGLFLTAVIAAFADSAMQPASATGTITKSKLNNPALKRAPPQPSLLSRVAAGATNLAGAVVRPLLPKKAAPPSQFGLGSHKAGTTVESAAAKKPQTTGDWLGLKRVGH